MEYIVLLSDHGHKTAFKITTAKVCTLDYFINSWNRDISPDKVWVSILNDMTVKARTLSASLIRKEFPQYINSDFYRSINY